jgi:hypothetical protein
VKEIVVRKSLAITMLIILAPVAARGEDLRLIPGKAAPFTVDDPASNIISYTPRGGSSPITLSISPTPPAHLLSEPSKDTGSALGLSYHFTPNLSFMASVPTAHRHDRENETSLGAAYQVTPGIHVEAGIGLSEQDNARDATNFSLSTRLRF